MQGVKSAEKAQKCRRPPPRSTSTSTRPTQAVDKTTTATTTAYSSSSSSTSQSYCFCPETEAHSLAAETALIRQPWPPQTVSRTHICRIFS